MDLSLILLVISHIVWSGIMWGSYFTTYPLFQRVDQQNFGPIHAQYEKGLPGGIYLPFSLMIVVTFYSTFFILEIKSITTILFLVAVLGGVITTAIGAAPLHIWLIKNGKNDFKVTTLLKWNFARMCFSLIGLLASVLLLLAN